MIIEPELLLSSFMETLCPSNVIEDVANLYIPQKPQAKQSVRFSHGRGAYADPKKKLYVNNVAASISPYAESFKYNCPVKVGIIYCFPFRKSDRNVSRGTFFYMEQRPDLDNLSKPVFDALTLSGMLTDDSNIVSTSVAKIRYEHVGIVIRVGKLVQTIALHT